VLTWLHDSLTAKLRATYPLEVSIRFIKCNLKTDGFETDEMHEKVPKKILPIRFIPVKCDREPLPNFEKVKYIEITPAFDGNQLWPTIVYRKNVVCGDEPQSQETIKQIFELYCLEVSMVLEFAKSVKNLFFHPTQPKLRLASQQMDNLFQMLDEIWCTTNPQLLQAENIETFKFPLLNLVKNTIAALNRKKFALAKWYDVGSVIAMAGVMLIGVTLLACATSAPVVGLGLVACIICAGIAALLLKLRPNNLPDAVIKQETAQLAERIAELLGHPSNQHIAHPSLVP
jgi:hypothetical protein